MPGIFDSTILETLRQFCPFLHYAIATLPVNDYQTELPPFDSGGFYFQDG
jgi:hypothetical protein